MDKFISWTVIHTQEFGWHLQIGDRESMQVPCKLSLSGQATFVFIFNQELMKTKCIIRELTVLRPTQHETKIVQPRPQNVLNLFWNRDGDKRCPGDGSGGYVVMISQHVRRIFSYEN